jgi:hypothetical protein
VRYTLIRGSDCSVHRFGTPIPKSPSNLSQRDLRLRKMTGFPLSSKME